MKTRIILFISLLLISFNANSAEPRGLRTITNTAFKPGEILKFRIHYGIMDAGEATLEVKSDYTNLGGRDCYHFVGNGKSVGAFDWFFKVRDRYESVVDKDAMVPWLFVRRVNEGGYIINQNVSFNHYSDSAKSEKATRTIDFTNAKEGDIFEITGYLDDAIFPMNLRFLGREIVSSKKGDFRCIKLRPMLQQGRVFKDQEDMTIWVSDDQNKIPVRVQADILVGSIKMDLVDYANLAGPPAIVK